MILEGIITTKGEDGRPHIAPMGAAVDDVADPPRDQLVLRPFKTSTTYGNLKRTRQGVFHVTDDVYLLARAAVGQMEQPPELVRAPMIDGWIIADACRWYALEVERIDDRSPRAEIETRIVDRGRIRDFLGFNRAKHAVVEAAILATRVRLLPAEQVLADLARFEVLVEKTGGTREREAFDFLKGYIRRTLGETP